MAQGKVISSTYVGCGTCHRLQRIDVYADGRVEVVCLMQCNTPLLLLPLPPSMITIFKQIDIWKLADFLNRLKCAADLLAIRGLGPAALTRVNKVLFDLGLPELK